MVREFQIQDIDSILDIYSHYCLDSIFTFDIQPPAKGDFKTKLLEINSKYPFYVFEESEEVLAYAYASTLKHKEAYDKSVEVTIYVKNSNHRAGVGYKLFEKLLSSLRKNGFHAAIAIITLPNVPSVSFHERFGFQKVGHLKEVGFKFNKWIDVGYWQLLF